MNTPRHIAKHFRDVFFGGNWTDSNLKGQLAGVTWEQATTQVHEFNSIATLTFHIHYFVGVALKVLQGGPLEGKDALSFDHPPINNQEDWENMLERIWKDANEFEALTEKLPEDKLWEPFTDKKFGNYYRNLNGIIEHTHYHLGQIALIKKLVQ